MKIIALLLGGLLLLGCVIARDNPEAKRGLGYNGKTEVTDGPLALTVTMDDSFTYVKVVARNAGEEPITLPFGEWTLGTKIEVAPVKVFDKPYGFFHGELTLSDPNGMIPPGAAITVYVGMRSHLSNVEDDDEWKMNPILPSKKPGAENIYDVTLGFSYQTEAGHARGKVVVKAS